MARCRGGADPAPRQSETTMATLPCVILYGNSVFLAGIRADLEERGRFAVLTLKPGCPDAPNIVRERRPAALLFDLSAAQLDCAIALLRDRPGPGLDRRRSIQRPHLGAVQPPGAACVGCRPGTGAHGEPSGLLASPGFSSTGRGLRHENPFPFDQVPIVRRPVCRAPYGRQVSTIRTIPLVAERSRAVWAHRRRFARRANDRDCRTRPGARLHLM